MKKFRRSFCVGTSKIWQESVSKEAQMAMVSPSTVETDSIASETFNTVSPSVSNKSHANDSQNGRISLGLILIDPMSRRFQFLRLEFDATKLTVADFLQQILLFPATDESLRAQRFNYICDLEGFEYEHDKYISDYVEGSEVIIAVPKTDSESSDDICSMAKSILRRPKIEEMMGPTGLCFAAPQTSEEVVQQKDSIISPNASSPKPMRGIGIAKSTTISNEKSISQDHSKSSNCMAYIFMGGILAYALQFLGDSKKQLNKSFRGLVTTKSKKWKEKAKIKSRMAMVSPSTVDTQSISSETNDDETLHTVDLGETSQMPETPTSKTLTYDIRSERRPRNDLSAIVLLLIDPMSRRFQFLRLEFDATKLTVADFLQQVLLFPATDESLRAQRFNYICDLEGFEYEHDKYISDYIEGSEVIIAVPKTDSESSDDICSMAKSILRRPKIEEMLRSTGIYFAAPHNSEEVVEEKEFSQSFQSTGATSECHHQETTSVSSFVEAAIEYPSTNSHNVEVAISTSPNDSSPDDSSPNDASPNDSSPDNSSPNDSSPDNSSPDVSSHKSMDVAGNQTVISYQIPLFDHC